MSNLPSRIGRYEINSLIGKGGMGAVYLARDTNPNVNRLVALKLLSGTLDSHLRARFVREARVLAALDHPAIVRIFDSGEFEGAPYIVMEYVRGETLAEIIKRKAPMTVGQKLKIMVELCSGLAQAHEAGVIHRDIKPANLVVDQSGRLKILDFGIARVAEGTLFGASMTMVNMQIGTPGYMSPEQLEGGEIDSRTDIFAAGALCYALLSYREAFTGANPQDIETAVLDSTPAPLSSLVPGLDPKLEAIVNKALAKNPRDRFQDATSMEQAFERQRWVEESLEQKAAPPTQMTEATPKTVATTVAPTVAKTAVAPTGPEGGQKRPDTGQKASRAGAAYQRAVAVYNQGGFDAARRFLMEALAEDPTHRESRALLERMAAPRRPQPPPPPPPPQFPSDDFDPDATLVTVLGGAGRPPSPAPFAAPPPLQPAAPTIISTAPAPPLASARPAVKAAARWTKHGKSLQMAGIAAGVVVVIAAVALLAIYLWPSGPQLRITRPTGGTVWAEGITCGTRDNDCTTNVKQGEWVELRAEQDDGYVFVGFEGDCSKSGRVQMTRASTCKAVFSALPKESAKGTFTLTVIRPTSGMVVGPGGIRCGSVDSACIVQYPEGTEVTLAAYADLNFSFRGFTGDCGANGTTTMSAARTCAATFVAEQKGASPSAAAAAGPRTPTARTPSRGATGSGNPVDALLPSLPASGNADPTAPKADIKDRVAVPLSPDELAKKDILKLLEEYRDAYERLDPAGVQRTYPTAPMKSLNATFNTYKTLKFELDGPLEILEIDAGRGIARVKGKYKLKPEPKAGSLKPYQREETFSLEQRNGVWLIRDWAFKLIK